MNICISKAIDDPLSGLIKNLLPAPVLLVQYLRITLCLISLLICLPISAQQISAQANKLYWDDIPRWEHSEKGVSNTHIQNTNWHAVSLDPDAMVTYRIPRSVFTRIYSETKETSENINLSRGDGNGLFIELNSFEHINNNLLFMPESNYWQLLIHNTSEKTITLSVMTSRASEENPFPQARKLITPENNHAQTNQTRWLTTPHLSQRDTFIYNNGDSKATYSVKGPSFIEVESLLLEAGIDEALPSYLMSSELDGELWQHWQHQAALYPFIRRSDLPKDNKNGTTEHLRSTYVEKYFLQIPEGQHTLSFNTLRPIALRVFESQSWGLSSNENFLYPKLEEQQHQQANYQQALNSLTDTLFKSPSAAVNQILGHWKDKQHPITASKERAVNRTQFYRTLAATTSRQPLRVFNLKPVVAKYSPIQGHPDLLVNNAADSLSASTFTELATKKEYLTFALPDLSGPSKLRIRLTGLNNQPAKFEFKDQLGQNSTLSYFPQFKSELLDSSNMSLEKDKVSTAEAFIPLNDLTKTLTVQALSGSTSKLQLAYLTSTLRSLHSEELTQALRQLNAKADSDIITFLQGKYVESSNKDISKKNVQANFRLLQSSLAELAHRIQVRSQQFEERLPNTDIRLTTNAPAPNRWQDKVQILIKQTAWASAIEFVSPLTLHHDISVRTSAAKLQATLLLEAGEFFLYEQWLLKLLNSAAYTSLSKYAENTLINRYTNLDRWSALEKLSAYRFIHTGDTAYLKLMGDSLLSESTLPLKQHIALILKELTFKQALLEKGLSDKTHPTTNLSVIESPLEKSPDSSGLWQTLQANTLTSASSVLLYGQALDNYSYRHKASPSQALTFTLDGPARLAISYRTLLDNGAKESPNSWLTLLDNDQAHYIATFKSRPSTDVSLIGSERQVSGEQRIEYQIGDGSHQIQIKPELGDVVIGLSTHSSTKERLNHFAVNDEATPSSLTQSDIDTELSVKTFNLKKANINPVKSLLRLIWAIEHSTQAPLPLIALGKALVEQQAKSPLLNRLSQRLTQFTGWQLEQQLIDSAGKRFITFKKTPISNPKIQIRQSLNGPEAESSQWLSARSDLNFNINSTSATALKLQIKQRLPLNAFTEGARVQLWLNGQLYRKISLEANNQFETLQLNLKAGNHQLRIIMEDAKSDQQVLFTAFRKEANNQWKLIEIPVRQAFSVSLEDNPVKVFAAASEWLRIDDLIKGQVYRSYHYQEENGVLTLLPKIGQSERLLRIYKLRQKPHLTDLSASFLPSNLPPKTSYKFTPTVKQWMLVDNLELGEENEGTWGGYMKFSNQASSDDTDEDISTSMNAIQIGHTYRKKLKDDQYWTSLSGDWQSNAYWKSDSFLRHTNNSGDTLGTEQRLIMADPQTDSQFSLKAKIQYFQASNRVSDNVLHFYTDAQYRHDWQVNRRQTMDASLTGFALFLDDRSPNAPNYIDPLVYSDYKRDHTYGWRLSGNWRYRLWHDSRWNIGTQLLSNETLLTLDQVSLQTGYQQYIKGLTAALSLRHTQRFNDHDRQQKSHQNKVKGSLRFHKWNSKGNEWYLGLNLVHDITLKESALTLAFGFNDSDGRGTRDYLPTELPMRDLYHQQSTQQQTMNTLSDQSSL